MKKLKLSELINTGFTVLFTSILILNFRTIEKAKILLSGYILLLTIQIIFINITPKKKFLEYVKDIFIPLLSVFFIFDSMTYIVHGINPKDIDYLLIMADYRLFGVYPTVWLERFSTPLLTEILQLSYSSYYFLPVILGIVLKKNRQDRGFEEGLSLIVLCFYLSYIGYLLFPALGPRYTMAHLQHTELKGVFAFDWIYHTLNSLEGIKRDAFPSGHTGVTLTVLYVAFKYSRKLFFVYLPITVLLIFATVYCRYHYVVDVLAGVALFLLTLFIYKILCLAYYAKYSNSNI